MIVVDKKNQKTKIFYETHKMRFFKIKDVIKYLKLNNLKYLSCIDLSTNKPVNPNTWGALIVAKKI